MSEGQNTTVVSAVATPAPAPVEKSTGTEVIEAYQEIFSPEFTKDVIAFFDNNKKISGRRIRKSLIALGKLSKEVKELMKEKRAEILALKNVKIAG